MSPARRRACIDHVRSALKLSERRVCRVLGQHRSTQRRRPKGPDDEQALIDDMTVLVRRYGRYGYRFHPVRPPCGERGKSLSTVRMDSHTDSALERLEIVETGRRRRWSAAAKERIVLESLSGPRLITATARRHNISRSLLLIWRRAFLARNGDDVAGFVPAVVTPVSALPAPVETPARVEIVLRDERRIIVSVR